MDIEQWWPKLAPGTRRWLIDHNGESIPAPVLTAIQEAGDALDPSNWWWDNDSDDLNFSDAGVDWIEAIANDEDGGIGRRVASV